MQDQHNSLHLSWLSIAREIRPRVIRRLWMRLPSMEERNWTPIYSMIETISLLLKRRIFKDLIRAISPALSRILQYKLHPTVKIMAFQRRLNSISDATYRRCRLVAGLDKHLIYWVKVQWLAKFKLSRRWPGPPLCITTMANRLAHIMGWLVSVIQRLKHWRYSKNYPILNHSFSTFL